MMQRARMVRAAIGVRRDEQVIAARVGALMWVVASLSAIGMALILPPGRAERTPLIALAAGGCAWGLICGLVLSRHYVRTWLIHASTVAAVGAVAAAIAVSGGARSPVWVCLFYIVVFSAYFMRPPAAAAYFLACVAVEGVVFLGAGPDISPDAGARLAVVGPAFLALGAAIAAGKRYMLRLRRDAERLAAEQGALRRVATAVVGGVSDARFYQLVAVEAAQLIGAEAAAILRATGPGRARVLGAWASDAARRSEAGDTISFAPDGELAQGLAAGRPCRVPADGVGRAVGRPGSGDAVVAPINVAGRSWGFLTVAGDDRAALTEDHLRRLAGFAGLISASITNIEDRAQLAAQAATDPLTGVANHRTFHERLTADMARSRRYGSPVAVAVIDVDHFKEVNDAGGHEAGDDRLIRIARCLNDAARAEDTLARIGGDEFAWILPETTAHEAVVALERVRRTILTTVGGSPAALPGGRRMPPVTISAGVCDTSRTLDPTELVRLADRALYSSKEHGRNQVRLYAPTESGGLVTHQTQ